MRHSGARWSTAKAGFALSVILALGAMAPSDAPVADAAMRGDVEAVRSLLRSGADVNGAQGDGMTALHWAARHGHRELSEVLVYAGARLNAGTRIGRYTPLHIAARGGRREVVDVLLRAGADPGLSTTNSGATPLHLAARSGDAETISLLLEHGALVDAKAGSWAQTPLIFAAALNRVEAIEILIAAGADPNLSSAAVDVVEMADADNAAERRLQEAIEGFREQQAGGPDWQPTPSQVQAAVDLARQVQTRWSEISRQEAEADVDAADGSDESVAPPAPDAEAVTGTSGEDAEEDPTSESEDQDAAAQGGPDADEDEGEGDESEGQGDESEGQGDSEEDDEPRPLSYAEQVGSWGGLTPLHHAVRQGHVEASLALLSGGAEIDRVTGDGTTPLLMAAINGQWDLARILIESGADPNAVSDAGATPLYAVLEREWQPRASYAHPTEHQRQETTHLEMMKLLLEAGADPNARLSKHLWYMEYTFGVLRGSGINLEGATPFWRAAYALDLEAMKLLASYGADPDIQTMKPPQRRRRPTPMQEESEPEESGQEPAAPESAEASEDDSGDETENATADADAAADTVPEAVEQESVGAEEPANQEDPEEEEEGPDPSGLPVVPVGGPAIHPIHAASGVGYGQSFAGNAHRYLPNGWLPAVKFLVEEMGADVNARDANGYTALHHAASRGDVELILYLVDQGADVMVVSRKGETTVDMANGPVQRVQPYPEAIALLESLGAVNNHNCVSCE